MVNNRIKRITLDKFFKKYIRENYNTVQIGTYEIDLQDIISLEVPYEELIQNDKVEQLTQIYLKEGELPYIPAVLRAPNGKYSLNFGSELLVVAEKVGLTKISAQVDVIIPDGYLTNEDKKILQSTSSEIEIINETLHRHKKNRVESNIDNNILHPFFNSNAKRFLDLGDIVQEAQQDKTNYYLMVARREKLISEIEFNNIE